MDKIRSILVRVRSHVERQLEAAHASMAPIDQVFFRNLLRVVALLVGLSCLLGYQALQYVNTMHVLLWLGLHNAGLLILVGWFRKYVRSAPEESIAYDMRLWRNLRIVFLLVGLFWALGVGVIYNASNITDRMVMFASLLVIFSGGGMATMALCPYAFLSFAIPTSFTFIFLSLKTSAEDGGLMSLILLISILHNAVLGRRVNQALKDTRQSHQEIQQLNNALRQQIEITEELAQSKSAFLAFASHDLQQPIHAIDITLDVLQVKLAGAHSALIQHMQSAINTVRGLLSTLLDISQLESGAVQPNVAVCQVHQILISIEQSLRPDAIKKGLRFRVKSFPVLVHTDPMFLNRILTNLAMNAIKYTDTGGVLIGCRLRSDRLVIEVRDTGVGIPQDEQGNIFKEFYRSPKSRAGNSKGVGLGLAIVSKLAGLLHHPLTVRSVLGKGSCFSISLPLAENVVRSKNQADIETPADALAAWALLAR